MRPACPFLIPLLLLLAHPLSERQTASAAEQGLWSLRPVQSLPPPDVKNRQWPQSPIDGFILARLETKNVTPARPADRRTLLRRVTYDLTGLPPTKPELDAFVGDPAPDVFAKVVERLLASPAYGERWGRHWLDVVRYADTAGETADYPVREAYKYRNYVIAAFNADKPYDEFLREQIAGDILARDGPRERYAERVAATGYLAIARRFGFDSENYQHLTIQDTIDTLGQSVLGLTLGCARCHDHKFDPISMSDYYALYGIFDSTRFPFPGSEQKPALRAMAPLVPPAEAARMRDAYDRQVGRLEIELEQRKLSKSKVKIASLDDMDGDFEAQAVSAGGSLGVLVPPWVSTGRVEVTTQAQSPYRNCYPRGGTVGVSFPSGAEERCIGQALPLRTAGLGSLYVNFDFRNSTGGKGSYRLFLGHGTGRSPAVEVSIAGDTLFVRNGNVTEPVRSLKTGVWYNVRLALNLGKRTYSGTVGTPSDMISFSDKRFPSTWEGILDYIQLDSLGHLSGVRPAHDVDNIAVRDMPIPECSTPLNEQRGVARPESSKGVGSLSKVATPFEDSGRATKECQRLIEQGPYELAYAVAEGTPHNVRIHKRGEPTRPGGEVPRRFLEILGGDKLPAEPNGSGRLALAHWLTRPENPLTARVIVNRIWQHHFGIGLVATENDFGTRGRPPTHPELLDFLAHYFQTHGWSVKAMHRLIVLSATYQLSADADRELVSADPANELHGRFNRLRLDAESIRDSMLFLSGNLDRSVGGSHPFPATGTPFTQHAPFTAVYETRRRSVYLMTQRIRRHPYLALFDGADPNASTARRRLTTVPTQALFLMNDPFVHEQAAGFAVRLLRLAGDESSRIKRAFEMALARPPSGQESQLAIAFLRGYERELRSAGVPLENQTAKSWAALARTLLCRNEFLFVD
jgi:Protein of unknown function (DUF1553)/Protein of unknown function (DUF1549)